MVRRFFSMFITWALNGHTSQVYVLTAFNPQNKASGTCCTGSMIEPTFAVYLGARRKTYANLWIVIPIMLDCNLITVCELIGLFL
jgi:hypothetical protein